MPVITSSWKAQKFRIYPCFGPHKPDQRFDWKQTEVHPPLWPLEPVGDGQELGVLRLAGHLPGDAARCLGGLRDTSQIVQETRAVGQGKEYSPLSNGLK